MMLLFRLLLLLFRCCLLLLSLMMLLLFRQRSWSIWSSPSGNKWVPLLHGIHWVAFSLYISLSVCVSPCVCLFLSSSILPSLCDKLPPPPFSVVGIYPPFAYIYIYVCVCVVSVAFCLLPCVSSPFLCGRNISLLMLISTLPPY